MASVPEQLETSSSLPRFRSVPERGLPVGRGLPRETSRLLRWGWSSLGVAFLTLGIVGIYLPGIPTTGPLILASYLFGKGNPELRRRMLESSLLAPYRSYLDGTKQMTWAIRMWAILCMWTSIAVSCWILSFSDTTATVGLVGCLVGGLMGTACILLYRSRSYGAVVR